MSKRSECTLQEMWLESPELALKEMGEYKLPPGVELWIGDFISKNSTLDWDSFSFFMELMTTRKGLSIVDLGSLFSLSLSNNFYSHENIDIFVKNEGYLPYIVKVLQKIEINQENLEAIQKNPQICMMLDQEIRTSIYKGKLLPSVLFKQLFDRVAFPDIKKILARKGIAPELLQKSSLRTVSPISEHAAEIYSLIYSRPLREDPWHPQKVDNRSKHDIVHVCRVAIYAYALVVLYASTEEKNFSNVALNLILQARKLLQNPENLNLLMISALLHDCGRQGEGRDHWDHDSGLILFYFMTEKLGVPSETAKIFAEATANKDAKPDFHYQLRQYAPGKYRWEHSSFPEYFPLYRLIFAIIGDADRLDVQRVRRIFFGDKLSYHHYFASKDENLLDIMAQLISEVSAVIEQQGDSFFKPDLNRKKEFQHPQAFADLVKDILSFDPATHPASRLQILPQLIKARQPVAKLGMIDYEDKDEKMMLKDINECKVFFRGISRPTYLIIGQISKRTGMTKAPRTNIELELDKMRRTPDRKTPAGHLGKNGFPNRSTTMPAYNVRTFTNAGLILSDEKISSEIVDVSKGNLGSGFGKKKNLASKPKFSKPEDVDTALKNVQRSAKNSDSEKKHLHNEIVLTAKNSQVKGIFFCEGPNSTNRQKTGVFHAFHRHVPILEAIAIQQAYAKKLGKNLQIWQYSCVPWFMIKKSYTDEQIVMLWTEMCKDYILLQIIQQKAVLPTDINQLKIKSMYGEQKGDSLSADVDYPQELRAAINLAIEDQLKVHGLVLEAQKAEPKIPTIPTELTKVAEVKTNKFRFKFGADENALKITSLKKYVSSLKIKSFSINLSAFFTNTLTQAAAVKILEGLKNPDKEVSFTSGELALINADATLKTMLKEQPSPSSTGPSAPV